MNLNVSGHHVEVTPAIRDYVVGKMQRIERHFELVIDVDVILTVEKLKQKAEVNVHVSGRNIHCECDDANMYAAIDVLVDKLDRQILKHKRKLRSHTHDAIKHQEEAV